MTPGINGKLNEFQAAFGLLSLKYIDQAILDRKKIAELYRLKLRSISGISFLEDMPGVRANYSYFPVFVDQNTYGLSRDGLYEALKQDGILARRYFFPLISDFPTYRGMPSANRSNLPVAARTADQVICLPMHAELTPEDVERVVGIIEKNTK